MLHLVLWNWRSCVYLPPFQTISLRLGSVFAPQCGEWPNKTYICWTSPISGRLSATHGSCYLTSPRARSLYPVIDLCWMTLLFSNKTTLGFNDLGVDRWAPWSDLSAQAWTWRAGLWPCEWCPAGADWNRANRVTLTVDTIICALRHWAAGKLVFSDNVPM